MINSVPSAVEYAAAVGVISSVPSGIEDAAAVGGGHHAQNAARLMCLVRGRGKVKRGGEGGDRGQG